MPCHRRQNRWCVTPLGLGTTSRWPLFPKPPPTRQSDRRAWRPCPSVRSCLRLPSINAVTFLSMAAWNHPGWRSRFVYFASYVVALRGSAVEPMTDTRPLSSVSQGLGYTCPRSPVANLASRGRNLAAGFLTGSCRRVYRVTLVETLDCTTYPVAAAWAAMGFGRPVSARLVRQAPETSPYGLGYFETLDLVAGMIGSALDRKEVVVEEAAATRDIDLGWSCFPKGTVAGQRRTSRGFANDRCLVELALCWTMSTDSLDPQWSDPEGFSIEIEGEPRVEATIRYAPPLTDGLSEESDVMRLPWSARQWPR